MMMISLWHQIVVVAALLCSQMQMSSQQQQQQQQRWRVSFVLSWPAGGRQDTQVGVNPTSQRKNSLVRTLLLLLLLLLLCKSLLLHLFVGSCA